MKTATITLNIGLLNNPLSHDSICEINEFETSRFAFALSAMFGERDYEFDFVMGEWEGEPEPTLVAQFELQYTDDKDLSWYVDRSTQRLSDMLTQDCIPALIQYDGGAETGYLCYSRRALNALEPTELYSFDREFFKPFKTRLLAYRTGLEITEHLEY